MKGRTSVKTDPLTHEIRVNNTLFKNSVPASRKALCVTKANRLMLLKELIALFFLWESYETLCGYNIDLCNVKGSGTYSSHCTLKR